MRERVVNLHPEESNNTNIMEQKQTLTYHSPAIREIELEGSTILCTSTTPYSEDPDYNPNIWG